MTLDELLVALTSEIEGARWIFVHPLDVPGDGFAGHSPTRRRHVRVHLAPRPELLGLDDKGREVWADAFRVECLREEDGWRRLELWGAGADPERALTILRDWMGAE